MATTTATLSLTSSDLLSEPLSLTTTSNCYKAGTTIGLDQTAGLQRYYLTSASGVDIVEELAASPSGADKNAKVYIANLTTANDKDYVRVSIADSVIGDLYPGDWCWFPWSQNAQHADIEIAPSVATGMWIEWMVIHEGHDLAAAADS